MTNVTTKLQGSILTLTIDLSKDHGLSASGKSNKIASTEGNVDISGGIKLGLNVYKPVVKTVV